MTSDDPKDVSPAIIAGCIVAFLSFGFSAAFGVFLRPMSEELGWAREVFSLSIALQAVFWGLSQPFAGAIADRHGTGRVLAFGGIVAALGFLIRAAIVDPTAFVIGGVIAGIGTGACSFPVVIVALGKIVSPEKRSFILGLGTAAASAGMFVAAPTLLALIPEYGWQTTLYMISASFLLILPAAYVIGQVSQPTVDTGGKSVGRAVRTAFTDPAFSPFRGLFCLWFPRCIHPDPPGRLYH